MTVQLPYSTVSPCSNSPQRDVCSNTGSCSWFFIDLGKRAAPCDWLQRSRGEDRLLRLRYRVFCPHEAGSIGIFDFLYCLLGTGRPGNGEGTYFDSFCRLEKWPQESGNIPSVFDVGML